MGLLSKSLTSLLWGLKSGTTDMAAAVEVTEGSAHTFEQAAMGFDPSTGRTPVEQTNNYSHTKLVTGTPTAVVKAAPGFVQNITITPVGAIAGATHLVLYDAASVPAVDAGAMTLIALHTTATINVQLNAQFNIGLCVAVGTVTAATGAVATHALTAGGTIIADIAFR